MPACTPQRLEVVAKTVQQQVVGVCRHAREQHGNRHDGEKQTAH